MKTTLFWLTMLAGFLPALYLVIRKPAISREIRPMVPYIWLLAFACFYEIVFSTFFRVNTRIWFRVYNLLDFVLILYYFYRLFEYRYKPLFCGFLSIYLALYIFLIFSWSWEDDQESYLTTIETILVYTCSFLWFKAMFTNLEVKSLWDSAAFYFISALILYFSGTFFLFAETNLIMHDETTSFTSYWMLNVALSLVLNLLIFVAVWKGQQKSIPYSG
jgi:hypothetical protein